MPLAYLNPNSLVFPDASDALTKPDGLLAVGGDLSPERILHAYRAGIFPWFSDGEPILWWSPNPRLVLFPEKLKIRRSLQKIIRKQSFTHTVDRDFAGVMQACAEPRPQQDGTWINKAMMQAYYRLHKSGYAHSIEAWQNDELVGGLYGLLIGKVFFGESMFSRCSHASQTAFVFLVDWLQQFEVQLIDCQVTTTHLQQFGAEEIPREAFLQHLNEFVSFTE